MYRLGERNHSHRRFYAWLLVFILLMVGLFFAGKQFLTADTKIGKTPAAVIRKITYDPPKLVTINEKLFSIGIPPGWKAVTFNDVPQPTYSWQGTTGDDKSRWISLYLDTSLPDFAVNRELHVERNGNAINVVSATSDNCTSFTGVKTDRRTGTAPAKWDGIDFLCDVGNYSRNVVGIASSDGFNSVLLIGATGQHTLFFTYTDSSAKPDYNIFTNSLRSFRLK